MSRESSDVPLQLAEMRRAFDAAFAAPVAKDQADTFAVLAIRIAGRPMAIRVGDLHGLVGRKKVMPLPGATLPLLGIVGLRGEAVPLYSLAATLGLASPNTTWRWLALVGADAPMAFAFDEIDAYLHLPVSALTALEVPEPHVLGVVAAAGASRPTLDMSSVATRAARPTPSHSPLERSHE